MLAIDPRGPNIISFRAKGHKPHTGRGVTCVETLQAYWNGLAKDGQIPYRVDMRADDLKGILSNLILFDKVSPSEIRIRLHGHSISELFRQDLTGLPLSAILSPDGRLALGDVVKNMFACGRPRIIQLEERGFSFGKKLKATLGLFPLLDQLGHPTKGIGFIDVEGIIKAKDYKFDISSISQNNQNITRFS